MTYQPLLLSCECGSVPSQILEVGFTSNYELVIHWWCRECARVTHDTRPISAFQAGRQAVPPASVLARAAAEDDDVRFLRSLGIQYPEGEEAPLPSRLHPGG